MYSVVFASLFSFLLACHANLPPVILSHIPPLRLVVAPQHHPSTSCRRRRCSGSPAAARQAALIHSTSLRICMLIVALGKQMIHSRAARPNAVGSWAASEPGRRLDGMLTTADVLLLLTEIVPTVRLGRRRCHETSLTCSPKRRSTRDALFGSLTGLCGLKYTRGESVSEGV